MKRILLAVLVISMTFYSCETTECCVHPPVLQGNWVLVEEKVSDGGPADWEKVKDGYEIRFNEDSTFYSERFNDCQEGNYSATNDEITYNYACSTYDEPYVDHYEFSGDHLLLYSVSPYRCIETCLYKFEKR